MEGSNERFDEDKAEKLANLVDLNVKLLIAPPSAGFEYGDGYATTHAVIDEKNGKILRFDEGPMPEPGQAHCLVRYKLATGDMARIAEEGKSFFSNVLGVDVHFSEPIPSNRLVGQALSTFDESIRAVNALAIQNMKEEEES